SDGKYRSVAIAMALAFAFNSYLFTPSYDDLSDDPVRWHINDYNKDVREWIVRGLSLKQAELITHFKLVPPGPPSPPPPEAAPEPEAAEPAEEPRPEPEFASSSWSSPYIPGSGNRGAGEDAEMAKVCGDVFEKAPSLFRVLRELKVDDAAWLNFAALIGSGPEGLQHGLAFVKLGSCLERTTN
ncbi:unnamed protein product, partial [Symbiodinium sp. CCMP2592]